MVIVVVEELVVEVRVAPFVGLVVVEKAQLPAVFRLVGASVDFELSQKLLQSLVVLFAIPLHLLYLLTRVIPQPKSPRLHSCA